MSSVCTLRLSTLVTPLTVSLHEEVSGSNLFPAILQSPGLGLKILAAGGRIWGDLFAAYGKPCRSGAWLSKSESLARRETVWNRVPRGFAIRVLCMPAKDVSLPHIVLPEDPNAAWLSYPFAFNAPEEEKYTIARQQLQFQSYSATVYGIEASLVNGPQPNPA